MKKEYIDCARLLQVEPALVEKIDVYMSEHMNVQGVVERVMKERDEEVEKACVALRVSKASTDEVRAHLRNAVLAHEKQLLHYLETVPGKNQFEKAAALAREVANVKKGLFLKKDIAMSILRARPPQNLLAYLHYASVDELLAHHDVLEAFSALRFMESTEWMHETFKNAYGSFGASDFEEREIEVRVLGEEWHEVAKKFVEKKHHNVSHLKEFGVIFLNPISEDVPGKFLRDFALLLHYFHEIEFYSKLFRNYLPDAKHFGARFEALLRGDIKLANEVGDNEWLIVQRYLVKDDPKDQRLFIPRTNPESVHWGRGERDIVEFGGRKAEIDLEFWRNLDWVGIPLDEKGSDVLSFDMEDNAMSTVSYEEKKEEYFFYHQREALWTKLFMEYAGGEEKMEELLLKNFDKGIVIFHK